jgi:hypothetical protein
VREEILAEAPSAPLRVFVVWAPNVPGDARDSVDRRLLSDRRVTNYWDRGGVAATWFSENVKAEPVNWDAYFLYGPDATWAATPGRPLASGSPVFESDARTELKSALEPLARG